MLYYPEGLLYDSPENISAFANIDSLKLAQNNKRILEGMATCCDEYHNLIVSLPNNIKGIIPREEGSIGIKEGTTRDIAIISRVSKPVCFVITDGIGTNCLTLSRRRAQELCQKNYISKLVSGDVIPAVITHFENYGSFVDIGCGTASLIPIDSISISRISHPRDRFRNGQQIFVVVKAISPDGKIFLSHKELLGTWLENAQQFNAGETVCGIVRSITSYGIFVELKPNLAGLAENKENVEPGDKVSVFIKSLIPEKMKIKLAIVDSFSNSSKPDPIKYFITKGNLK
ncbi:MAG: S1 RNA-binding domain-containing protein, partial [Oscillospiraceae bacterium]|nr:S1 RNA-binding domain-containing protein [Oscillospiraceae bacterium]